METRNATKVDSKAHYKDGERLLRIRRLDAKTQKDFAEAFEVSVGTIANYERARTEMPPSFSRSIYNKYGLNPTPLDPEEDPNLILQRRGKFANIKKTKEPRPLLPLLFELRAKMRALRENAHSKKRLATENMVHAAFFVVTTLVWVEQLRRFFASGTQIIELAFDILFVSAFFAMCALMAFVLPSLSRSARIGLDNGLPGLETALSDGREAVFSCGSEGVPRQIE